MARPTPEELEKAKAAAAAVEAQFKMKDHHATLRNSRLVLLIVACFEALLAVVAYYYGGINPIFYFEVIFSVVFGALYFFSKNYPTPALLLALLIYLVPQLLFLFFLPVMFDNGLTWKLLILIALSAGLYSSTKIPKPKPGGKSDLLDDNDLETAI